MFGKKKKQEVADGDKVFLASGWFDDEQKSSLESAIKVLDQFNMNYYCAFKHGLVLNDKSKWKDREFAFATDLDELERCTIMIAVIDNFDAGTMFEMGYFYKLGKPIIAYTSMKERGLNLMLANSCNVFANREAELLTITKAIQEDKLSDVENKWRGKVY